MKKYSLTIITLAISLLGFSQNISIESPGTGKTPFINPVFNRIINNATLDSFYKKLYDLKRTGKGVVTIVHIGDSHIQADFLSAVVRNNLQQFFGDAGRGLVFPYQLAKSNAPQDIYSSSSISWQYNRLAHPEIPITAGVSGFVLRTDKTVASFNLGVRSGTLFNRIKLFADSSNSWIVQTEKENAPIVLQKDANDTLSYFKVDLEQPAASFTLSSLPSDHSKEFYGVSLENSSAGVLYHSIGVNGARYDQYNAATRFWQQLSALQADLFIISLGTNDAQRTDFNEPSFQQQLELFIHNLKLAAPGAAILITTAADSYYKRRHSNPILRSINASLNNYCIKNNIPLWDLYRISSGYGSAYKWLKMGLMNNDRIHFTSEGYHIQGQLLFNALAREYNNYISSY
jgi:lysophospholipase L1-like esterase